MYALGHILDIYDIKQQSSGSIVLLNARFSCLFVSLHNGGMPIHSALKVGFMLQVLLQKYSGVINEFCLDRHFFSTATLETGGSGSRKNDPSAQHDSTVPVSAPTGTQMPAPTEIPSGFSSRTEDYYDSDNFGWEGNERGVAFKDSVNTKSTSLDYLGPLPPPFLFPVVSLRCVKVVF